jgi:MoxR-like ATPase
VHVHTRRVIDASSSLTASVAARLEQEIERVLIGQEQAVHDVLLAVLAGGHCLLVGPSGTGKTLMASLVAEAAGLSLATVPCTPVSTGAFLSSDAVAFEELARAQPDVRVSLLDRQPAGTLVFATHNPHDRYEWPLTEGELDRFLLSTPFDYPTAEEERELLRRTSRAGMAAANAVIDPGDLQRARAEVREVPAASNVIEYAARLARSTRPAADGERPDFVMELVAAGAGPRGSQALLAAARAHALIDGEAAVSLDDVDAVAPAVLRHRLTLTDAARRQGLTSDDVISRILPVARQ